MIITIKTAINGAVVAYDDEDGAPAQTMVYRWDSEGHATALKDFVQLLYEIADKLGHTGSKYVRERVSIQIVHGSDYECQTECDICSEEDDSRDASHHWASKVAEANRRLAEERQAHIKTLEELIQKLDDDWRKCPEWEWEWVKDAMTKKINQLRERNND